MGTAASRQSRHGVGTGCQGHYSAPLGWGRWLGSPWSQQKRSGWAWCFWSPSEGLQSAGWKSKPPLGTDNRISAPWGERGCFARSTTARPGSCSFLGVPAASWAWIISPFSNQIRAFTKNNAPCACSYWLCPEPAHQLPAAARIILGDEPRFLTHSRAKQSKPQPTYQCRGTGTKKPPSNLTQRIGIALKKRKFESVILTFRKKNLAGGRTEGKLGFAMSRNKNSEQLGRACMQNMPTQAVPTGEGGRAPLFFKHCGNASAAAKPRFWNNTRRRKGSQRLYKAEDAFY